MMFKPAKVRARKLNRASRPVAGRGQTRGQIYHCLALKSAPPATGRGVLVRCKNLRAEAFGTMKRIYAAFEMAVDTGELAREAQKHSWANIAETRGSVVRLLLGARRSYIPEYP